MTAKNQVVANSFKKQTKIQSIFSIDDKIMTSASDKSLFVLRIKSSDQISIGIGQGPARKIKCRSLGDFICILPFKKYKSQLGNKNGIWVQFKSDCEPEKCAFGYSAYVKESID